MEITDQQHGKRYLERRAHVYVGRQMITRSLMVQLFPVQLYESREVPDRKRFSFPSYTDA